ncbi:TetR family transcriptional regulator [Streptosporangium sp. NPDC000563]|uniref:TetR/AcrR family transcriptional regulator n=1 Tax=Streptosporangium sp. NPDC000563 TaxID=3154366 RepID=UPI0033315933
MRLDNDLTARARIGNAALELFGSEGVGRVSIRAIAAKAGVSPALVVHHFGSKEGLRAACDQYVISLVRGDPDDPVDLADASGLAAMLEEAEPVRRYLARAFLDATPEAAALFDEIVETTQAWLDQGSAEGWARPTGDARARAALYVTWLLAPLAFGEHLSRVLGVADLHSTDATLRYSQTSLDMLTHGVFTDERLLSAWNSAAANRGTP